MESFAAESLLHPKIALFYKINEEIGDNGEFPRYIKEDLTFDWNNLKELLLAGRKWSKEDPEFPKKYEEYLSYFKLIERVLVQSQKALEQANVNSDDTDNDWLRKLQWLGHETQMRTIIKEHLAPTSETSNVENILFLTSILENGLANIYFTMTKKAPPHLLRDLLDTKELRDIFGICPILFLKIVMGSADSVNLRNIVWHGFPLPSEVPFCYASTLLIAAASLSVVVEKMPFKLEARPQIMDFNKYVFKIKAASIDLTLLDEIAKMEEAVEFSLWTGDYEHKAFWYQILQHYKNERYWQFAILILPQIELLLRRMYGEANDFDFTAKLDEYYITMNTIFEAKDNRLLSGNLSKGILHLLYDVFISPHGMRIRDKVSHGEVDLNCIDKNLCSILLYAGMNLISSNESYPLDNYKSRFHLNCLAFECLDAAKRCILELTAMKTPSNLGAEFNWDQDSIAALQALEIIRPVEIFDRHKKEAEIVGFIMKIAQLVVQVCENYKTSFTERFRMLLSHELRSRVRKTLTRMVQTMKVIGVTLENIIQCLAGMNNLLQSETNKWFEDTYANTQRFLKQTLTIVENFVRFSDKDSNEWLNAVECCCRFQRLSTNFLVTFI